MAFTHGSNADVSVDGTNISAYVDSISFSRSVDTAEVTAFGNDDKAFIAGLEDGSFSISGPYDPTLDGVMAGCFDAATVTVFFGPSGSGSGAIKYSASAFITDYTPDMGVSNRVQWSASFQKSGDLTYGTY